MSWQFTWHDALAVAIVLWAAWHLMRRVIGVLRRDRVTGCGTCPGCGSAAKRIGGYRKTVVPVELLVKSAKPD
jgi:hypothetical protein